MKTALCVLTLMLTLTPLLSAQSAEVVVTGTRTFAADPGQPQQTLTADDLKRREGQSLVEILSSLTGLSFRNVTGALGDDEPAAAGFGENSLGRILVLLDGAELNPPDMGKLNWQLVPVSRLASITFLPGSASTLYGDKAVAGVLDLRTKSHGLPVVEAAGSYGSFNTNSQNLSLAQDWPQFSVNLSLLRQASDGERQRTASSALTGQINLSHNLDSWTTRLSGLVSRTANQMPGGLTKTDFDARSLKAANLADDTSTDRLQVRLTSQDAKAFHPWSLASGYSASRSLANTTSFSLTTDTIQQTADLSGQLELNQDLWPALSLPVGLEGRGWRLDVTKANLPQAPFTTSLHQLESGFYLNPTVTLESLVLRAGARAAWFNRGVDQGAAALQGRADSRWALPTQASVWWQVAPGLGLSAAYEGVFRFPLLDEQVAFSGFGADGFNTTLRPEQGHSGRLTAEWQPVDHWSAKVSGNSQWLMDEVYYNNTTWLNENRSSPTVRHFVTGQVGYQTDLIQLDLHGQWVDARLTDGPNTGKFIPLVAAWTAGASVSVEPVAGLTLDARYQWQSPQFAGGDEANQAERLAAYGLVGAGLSGQWGNFRAYLRAENLFDVNYAQAIYWGTYYPGQGRSWQAGAAWKL